MKVHSPFFRSFGFVNQPICGAPFIQLYFCSSSSALFSVNICKRAVLPPPPVPGLWLINLINLTEPSCLISNSPVSCISNLISLDGSCVVLNLYEYPPSFGVAIISMPSSSNLPAASAANTADDEDGDPATACRCCVVVFSILPPAPLAAAAFPNNLLINPARYAK